jgi:hypothetical protein
LRSKGFEIGIKFEQVFTFLCSALLLSSCFSGKINQTKDQQPHGLWITYTDSSETKVVTKGRFRNGEQKGKWIYNTLQGEKDRTEVYRGSKIKIRHYHSNGKLAVKGKGRVVKENKKLHFYYYGSWYYYTEAGKLHKIAYFENGRLVKEDQKIKGGSSAYDSLNLELMQLDKDFVRYRDTMQRTMNKNGKNSPEYTVLVELARENDSLVYARIEKIIQRFGYPSKLYTGKNNEVIFYIIGFAPWQVKEKYVEVFRNAAKRNEISLTGFAFFEDKYFLGKYGYQIYGTQYKFGEKHEPIYYPVKDLSNMNDRRKLMGLEPASLLRYAEVK